MTELGIRVEADPERLTQVLHKHSDCHCRRRNPDHGAAQFFDR
jgi:hypothetical protein